METKKIPLSEEPRVPHPTVPPESVEIFQDLTRVETDIHIEGLATLHIDPHSRAIAWCIQPRGTDALFDVRVLRPEDRVTISSAQGEVLFDGPLTSTFYLLNPIRIYQEICGQAPPDTGFLIYWSPQGIDPHTWLSFFGVGNSITVQRHVTALI